MRLPSFAGKNRSGFHPSELRRQPKPAGPRSLRGGRFLHRLDGQDPRLGARSHSWPGSMPRAIRALVAMLFIVGRFVRWKSQGVEVQGCADKTGNPDHGVSAHFLASLSSAILSPKHKPFWPRLQGARIGPWKGQKHGSDAAGSPPYRTYLPAALCKHWRFYKIGLVTKYY